MVRVPGWLFPFLIPVVLVGVVMLISSGTALGKAGAIALALGSFIVWRLIDVKTHPPDPELRRKQFGGFDAHESPYEIYPRPDSEPEPANDHSQRS